MQVHVDTIADLTNVTHHNLVRVMYFKFTLSYLAFLHLYKPRGFKFWPWFSFLWLIQVDVLPVELLFVSLLFSAVVMTPSPVVTWVVSLVTAAVLVSRDGCGIPLELLSMRS